MVDIETYKFDTNVVEKLENIKQNKSKMKT